MSLSSKSSISRYDNIGQRLGTMYPIFFRDCKNRFEFNYFNFGIRQRTESIDYYILVDIIRAKTECQAKDSCHYNIKSSYHLALLYYIRHMLSNP